MSLSQSQCTSVVPRPSCSVEGGGMGPRLSVLVMQASCNFLHRKIRLAHKTTSVINLYKMTECPICRYWTLLDRLHCKRVMSGDYYTSHMSRS